LPVRRQSRRHAAIFACGAESFLVQCLPVGCTTWKDGAVALLFWSRSRFARLGCLAPALAAALFAARADALSIIGLTPAKNLTNTLDSTTDTGSNRMQSTSTVATTLAPVAAADTLGSFTEFITRYSMMVAADRTQTTGGANTVNMTSNYSITFTCQQSDARDRAVDIDTLRVGALTIVTDSTGNGTLNLGASPAHSISRPRPVRPDRPEPHRHELREYVVQPERDHVSVTRTPPRPPTR
jgi:hypothetical protein